MDASIGEFSFDSRCRAHRDSSQTIPDATFTKVEFDVEDYDDKSEYDNTINYRFTAIEAGYYAFGACCSLVGLSDGKSMVVCIKLNGSYFLTNYKRVGAAGDAYQTIHGDMKLAAGDYLEIFLYHNQGSSLGMDLGLGKPSFYVHRFA